MLNVKRRSAPPAGETLIAEKNRLTEYIAHIQRTSLVDNYESIRISRSYQIRDLKELDREWYEELREQFKNRCAYCERSISKNGVVDYFRPVDGVKEVDFSGKKTQNDGDFHYIWLAYEWNNMIFCCSDCLSEKGNYFPVEGKRARLFSNTRYEKHLFVDPCKDLPEDHMYHNFEGDVLSKSWKGDVTIGLLNLNRQELVLWRKGQIETINNLLVNFGDPYIINEISQRYHSGEFSDSLIKQIIGEWLINESSTKRTSLQREDVYKQFFYILYGNFKTDKEFTDRLRKYTYNYYRNGITDEQFQITKSERIRSIRLTNIRGVTFEHFFEKNGKEESWLMLLGENGTGKTTVLKAIAMALTKSWTGLNIKPFSYVDGDNYAEISISLNNTSSPVQVIFENQDIVHNNVPEKIPVIAYGAIRLIPRRLRKNREGHSQNNVKNLFSTKDSDYFVNHPGEWLTDQETMRRVAQVILDILPFDEHERVDMVIDRKRRAFIEWDGKMIPFHELSSGYQSIIALIADITKLVYKGTNSGKFAEGIVLIDEIDAHLHPSWKLNIVTKLRKSFPNIQFIVTSHDPLCLRGTRYGELTVLKRSRTGIKVVDKLPSPEGMQIDQILMSEFFDMDSTLGPENDRLIKQYQELLTRELSIHDEKELALIEERLDHPNIKYLGYTNRDRLMYKAIDQFIANRKNEKCSYNELDEETQHKVLQIWESEEEL